MHWVDAETPASMVRSLREIGTTHYRHLPGMQMLQSEKDEATVAAMVYQAMLADATAVATTAARDSNGRFTMFAAAAAAGSPARTTNAAKSPCVSAATISPSARARRFAS